MKIRKYQSDHQRSILTGMIVHDEVLAKIYQRVGKEHHPFGQKWMDLISKWCFGHFIKYGRAPRKSILSIFETYAESAQDSDSVELVEKFLGGLNDDYVSLKKEINEGHLIDLASHHFSKVRYKRMLSSVQAALDKNDLEEARVKYDACQRIDFSSTDWDEPFSKESIRDTFYRVEEAESLIHYPGDLDRFLSPYFKRCDFVAFSGPEKRGKSYWLVDTVWRAVKQKRKVLYYVFGDMPKHEVYQRLYCRVTSRPWKSMELEIPRKFILEKGRKIGHREFETQFRKGLTPRDVWDARKKLLRTTASGQINLKVKTSGGYTISAGDIERDVRNFALRDGWVPDVVVVDYADLLLSEGSVRTQDIRHQINMSWVILRRIALESSCLVVTATQLAASSYKDKWVMRMGDFSEDKRKNAHVTGMLGINRTEDEKQQSIYRLNWIVLRGGHWAENQVVWTAGNFHFSNPCIISRL